MKVVASVLLVLNLCMYVIILGIGGWEMNKSIKNTATGLFLVFGLIAGCVGFASLISGLNHVCLWSNDTLPAAVSAATVAWAHTVLALGFATKEIKLHIKNSRLSTMEAFIIILSATKLLYIFAIHGVRK
ncbi:hypothetical protein DCAR_0208946 [Daucus carota subsp. sativus]|uniref:Uncharacterized protein n=1 Tax=Daucus carota subsp. sativus TaxID=79200 RepID=A0AAF0WK42_DAUCS|nr:hypothetical protein DCAR_0208946 [Daucus carota subsp. sativus]